MTGRQFDKYNTLSMMMLQREIMMIHQQSTPPHKLSIDDLK